MPARAVKHWLDDVYALYHRRELVHPDPLEFLYDYADPRDREIVALIASSLAYGRVAQILRSVSVVLDRMGPAPSRFVARSSHGSLRGALADFRHRFTTGDDLAAMLFRAGQAVKKYGSLGECFLAGFNRHDDTEVSALSRFAHELSPADRAGHFSLLPSPARGSACKRLNLFLRWMVRQDDVDPGGWQGIPACCLIVPLDTHLHRICRALKLTRRKQADLRTAVEITGAFRTIAPDDPVRYDFSLTRLGIREDLGRLGLLKKGDYAGIG